MEHNHGYIYKLEVIILYIMRDFTSNQCKSFRIGEIWSRDLVSVTSLAAEFLSALKFSNQFVW